MFTGYLDRIDDGEIVGWIVGGSRHVVPLVLVDGVPTENLETDVPRADVSQALQVSAHCGFRSRILTRVHGKASVELFAVTEAGLYPVLQTEVEVHFEPGGMSGLMRAAEIARQPDAVAIAVWEGAHNPVGRAKVLYDIVSRRRPAIIFAYVFGEFGKTIWPPIANLDIEVMLVPYQQRFHYKRAFQKLGITFDTVWICKDRLPSFEMAQCISHDQTATILDIDDDETLFAAASSQKLKPYGLAGANKAAFLRDGVAVRSVASASLRERFGGRIVRHTRAEMEAHPIRRRGSAFRIGFIGTVRPHKNLEAAARAVAAYRHRKNVDVRLCVGGVFDPPTLAERLEENGVTIMKMVPADELQKKLAEFDAVLTGYPSSDGDAAEISRWQISSKIGDALAAGVPALVPATASVSDLAHVPGVFVYDERSFETMLERALHFDEPVVLPDEFKSDHAYEVFSELEREARDAVVPNMALSTPAAVSPGALQPTLLLLWKQDDAGLFGRRVDQIARVHAQEHARHRTIVLEVSDNAGHSAATDARFNNACDIIADAAAHKRFTTSASESDISYRRLHVSGKAGVDTFVAAFEEFLFVNNLFPDNTTIIVFPYKDLFSTIFHLLTSYPLFCDIIDYHLNWSCASQKPNVVHQYYVLSLLSKSCIFNSQNNLDIFVRQGFLATTDIHFLPNWYVPPIRWNKPAMQGKPARGIIYSGNLNNRIDWPLLGKCAELISEKEEFLYLFGSADAAEDQLLALLSTHTNVVYCGAVIEDDVLCVASQCMAAIVPHLLDNHSLFMDPMKLRMYECVGIPCVTTCIPGVTFSSGTLLSSQSHQEFLANLDKILGGGEIMSMSPRPKPHIGHQYLTILNLLSNEAAAGSDVRASSNLNRLSEVS